ncbi:DNA polymerase III subunit gamma and tau [Schaalia georgiae]|nr:DNA polymerase III subunit gamma and tau [Schaalia georgiae]
MTTALYRRYRPDTFDEVIGQEHVTEPLKAALRANRVTHAYLFSGPRGCGKTTSARILARCLNCAQGPTDAPCGQCASCKELATGGSGSLDVVEIDAASHGGVDDARDLRERATFAPVRDRYKIFIIDEAHMVTNQGFNALLKLVEEPPEHVKFVFATTEPERVIGTIRSRTHHYPFRLVPPDVLGPYLKELCAQERVRAGDGVLPMVMRSGGGSVRDTLSVLDQLMAGAIDGEVSYATAVALLGYTDSALLDESVDALAGGDGAGAYRVVERMVESGHDPRRFVEDLLQRLRDLLIIAVAGDGARDVLSDAPADQFERMQLQAKNWGPKGLSRAADLVDEALRSMTGATSPRLQLELLVGRILVPVAPAQPEGALEGAVGLVGGGSPHEAAPVGSDTASGASGGGAQGKGRFGAREAREELERARRQREAGERGHGTRRGDGEAAPGERAPERGARAQDSAGWARAEAESRPSAPTWADAPEGGDGPAGSGSVPAWGGPEAGAPAPQGARADSRDRGGARDGERRDDKWGRSGARDGENHGDRLGGGAPRDSARDHGGAQVGADGADSTDGSGQRGASSSSDADMLRGRWTEVVERLASISRVTWSMVGGNGQLGAVDGTEVVVLFPVEAMVGAFTRGNRAGDVERAIREATGLKVTVSAQVGQAGGGQTVTGPSAQAAHPQGGARRWVSQPPPFDGAAPGAAERSNADAPTATGAPTAMEEPSPRASDGWPEPAGAQSASGPAAPPAVPAPAEGGWPEPAGVPDALQHGTDSRSGAAPSAPTGRAVRTAQGAPREGAGASHDGAGAARGGEAPRGEAGPQSGTGSHGDGPAGGVAAADGAAQRSRRKRAFTVFTYPGDEEAPGGGHNAQDRRSPASAHSAQDRGAPAPAPQWSGPERDGAPDVPPVSARTPEPAPRDPSLPDEPAFVDGPDDDWADTTPSPAVPSGWSEAVAVPGGASVSFEDAPAPRAPSPSRGGAPDAPPAPRAPSPAARAAQEEHPRPTGRQAAEAALRERALRAPAPGPRVGAADDDSASIDDEDISDSSVVGLAAVLEVLGGRVIEEKTTEGTY